MRLLFDLIAQKSVFEKTLFPAFPSPVEGVAQGGPRVKSFFAQGSESKGWFLSFRPRCNNRAFASFTCLPAIAALIVAAALPGAVCAEAPLTLSDAQRRAADFSRQLAAEDAAVAAYRDMAAAAGTLPDPVLKLGIDNLPVDGADRYSLTRDFMTMRRIGIAQEYTRAEKRRLRSERGEHDVERAIAERDAALVEIERDTALAWLARYYAEAAARLVAEQISEARLAIDAAEAAYQGGRGSQADFIAARGALAELENRASEAEQRVRVAQIALARWVGDAADAPLAERPDIDVIDPELLAIEHHLPHHPDIAVLSQQVEIAKIEAKLARAERKPDWSWEVMYGARGDAYSNMVSVGVSVPLQWNQKNRQDRELAAKLAAADQARAQREDMWRMHLAEVRMTMEEWTEGLVRRDRYARELIPLADDRIAAELAAYRGGKAALADVLAARRAALDVRLQALQTEAEVARNWARIVFLFPQQVLAPSTQGEASPSSAMMPLTGGLP